MRQLLWTPGFEEDRSKLRTDLERKIINEAIEAFESERVVLHPLTQALPSDGLWYVLAPPFMMIVGTDGIDHWGIGIERRFW